MRGIIECMKKALLIALSIYLLSFTTGDVFAEEGCSKDRFLELANKHDLRGTTSAIFTIESEHLRFQFENYAVQLSDELKEEKNRLYSRYNQIKAAIAVGCYGNTVGSPEVSMEERRKTIDRYINESGLNPERLSVEELLRLKELKKQELINREALQNVESSPTPSSSPKVVSTPKPSPTATPVAEIIEEEVIEPEESIAPLVTDEQTVETSENEGLLQRMVNSITSFFSKVFSF